MKVARWLFFATLVVSSMTGEQPLWNDPIGGFGWYVHADLKSSMPITGIPLNPIEICLIVCMVLWFVRSGPDRQRYAFQPGRMLTPIVWFGVALAFGVIWGLLRGNDNLIFALDEVRGMGTMIIVYFLVGMLLHSEQDLTHLVWCGLAICGGLALDNTLRYFLVLQQSGINDLSYDHNDSVMLSFGVVLCAGLFLFRCTRAQRRVALVLMPLSILALELMHRRVAFVLLPIGIALLTVILFRLRPKLFWQVVPVMAVIVAIYLAAFWNNTGALGQPARAIRSQISPDPRDFSSDIYRVIEHQDILMNIASSGVFGLGFGQPFIFYEPLPDLSFWTFWHYTPHNAILWIWMDGGIPTFLTFFWVMGSGVYLGTQELASRREAWSLAAHLRAPRPRGRSRQKVGHIHSTASARTKPVITSAAAPDVPPWAQTGPRSKATCRRSDGSPIALLAAGVSLIVMQVTYSYVDLGLSSRNLLLLGVLLGVMARPFVSAPTRPRRKLGADPAPDPERPTQTQIANSGAGLHAVAVGRAGVLPSPNAERATSTRTNARAWSDDRTGDTHRYSRHRATNRDESGQEDHADADLTAFVE